MYKETADQISENLLKDFIDSDDESKFVVPKPLSDNKKQSSFKYNTNDPKVKIADFSQNKKFDPNDFGDQYQQISKKGKDMYKQAFPTLGAVFEQKDNEDVV